MDIKVSYVCNYIWLQRTGVVTNYGTKWRDIAMATTNDITGDPLVSKPATEKYRDGYDRIFDKSDTKKKGGSKNQKVLG